MNKSTKKSILKWRTLLLSKKNDADVDLSASCDAISFTDRTVNDENFQSCESSPELEESEHIWHLRCSSHSAKGLHERNEDRMITRMGIKINTATNEPRFIDFFAVIDGHGGDTCAQWLMDNMETDIHDSPVWAEQNIVLVERLKSSVEHTLRRAEERFTLYAEAKNNQSGSCVVVCMHCEGHLCVGNIGDCLAMLSIPSHGDTPDQIVDLSMPHRSEIPAEAKRIFEADGTVISNRAFGVLEPSRSIGDLDLKKYRIGAVIAKPYIAVTKVPFPADASFLSSRKLRNARSPFLVLASDGCWDVLKKEQVADICPHFIKKWTKKPSKSNPAKQLVKTAVRNGSKDDITAVIVHFQLGSPCSAL